MAKLLRQLVAAWRRLERAAPPTAPDGGLGGQLRGRAGAWAAALAAASFAGFAALAPDALKNGDAAVYADHIRRADFSERTVHLGYYLLGIAWTGGRDVFSDLWLNLLSAACAAVAIAALFLFGRAVAGERPALLAAVSLAVGYLFVENAVHAEVYAAGACLLLVSLLLWHYDRPVGGGAAFAAAVLVTPSALLAAPAVAAWRPRWRPLAAFGLTAAVLTALGVAWVLADFLYGGRGLLRAVGGGVDLERALLKEGYELYLAFLAAAPFLALGAWEAARRPRLRRFALALATLWLVYLFFGEKFADVPVQLPTWTLAALLAGLGGDRFLTLAGAAAGGRRGRALLAVAAAALGALAPVALLVAARPRTETLARLPAAAPLAAAAAIAAAALAAAVLAARGSRRAGWPLLAAALAVNLGVTVLLLRATNAEVRAYKESVLAAAALAPDHLAVGEWSRGVLFNHYLGREPFDPLWINKAWLRPGVDGEEPLLARRRWRAALAAGRGVWLLDPDPAVAAELRAHGYALAPFRTLTHAVAPPRPGPRRPPEEGATEK